MDTAPPLNPDKFNTPKKTTKFKHLIKEKSKATLKTKNRYEVLSDESEKERDSDDEPDNRLPKRVKPNTPKRPKTKEQPPKVNKKTVMPPIVNDETTKNHKNMVKNIKETVKGVFTLKHTNQSTILFVEEEEDYTRVLANIRAEKIPHHTYTQKQDKSHAFVLRGLTNGTEIDDIREDM